jgi:hypothetical protein
MVIHAVRYICPEDGLERFSNNVTTDIEINYSLRSLYDSPVGNVSAKAYTVVKCAACGKSHRYLSASEEESV